MPADVWHIVAADGTKVLAQIREHDGAVWLHPTLSNEELRAVTVTIAQQLHAACWRIARDVMYDAIDLLTRKEL